MKILIHEQEWRNTSGRAYDIQNCCTLLLFYFKRLLTWRYVQRMWIKERTAVCIYEGEG